MTRQIRGPRPLQSWCGRRAHPFPRARALAGSADVSPSPAGLDILNTNTRLKAWSLLLRLSHGLEPRAGPLQMAERVNSLTLVPPGKVPLSRQMPKAPVWHAWGCCGHKERMASLLFRWCDGETGLLQPSLRISKLHAWTARPISAGGGRTEPQAWEIPGGSHGHGSHGTQI